MSGDQPRMHEAEQEEGAGTAWWAMSADAVAGQMDVDPRDGLKEREARRRLHRHGPNLLREAETLPWYVVLGRQFKNTVVLLLAAAAVASLALGHTLEGLSIVVVITLNAAIGFALEFRANRAMEALQKLGRTEAVVVRGGERHRISAVDLVPGDIILLEEGLAVPADARLLETTELRVDESALTGESVPAAKNAGATLEPEASLADRENMVYRSTTVSTGNARAVVTGTGSDTEIGRVGELISGIAEGLTPLERRLEKLSHKLIWVCLGVAIVVAAAGIIQGEAVWGMIEAGIALAVAAIPEGLPAVATITLAMEMRRMARLNALVRRLPAVETLGSVTRVCTDKTGTLTRGEMTLRILALPDQEVEITGSGYLPEGQLRSGNQSVDMAESARLRAALTVGALCNNAGLSQKQGGEWSITGDPTEGALLVGARKAGIDAEQFRREHPEIREYPFSSQVMMMGTVHEGLSDVLPGEGEKAVCVKGAPGRVLRSCDRVLTSEGSRELDEETRERLKKRNEDLASGGYRVLGLAYRRVLGVPEKPEDAYRELVWIGLAGIMDPPREEARRTVETLTRAGVGTVMITGDQPMTARAIAAELGISPADGAVLSGAELEELSDEELAERLGASEVFARVSPEHKLRILKGEQKRGEVCAMLGDGVNDAAALKAADIGVAMGIRGTDVAKETADMVLLDDSFTTIGVAVHRGRVIYDNIRKFITYLFSCNLSEIFTMLAGSLLGYPLILLPLQILWMNLITDVFPALALAAEPGEKDVMDRPPADPAEPLIAPRMVRAIGGYGMLLSLAAVGAFVYGLSAHGYRVGERFPAVTMSFLTVGFGQLFHVFNCRKDRRPMRLADWLSNNWVIGAVLLSAGLMLAAVYVPVLSRVLHTIPPTRRDWLVIFGFSLVPLAFGQAWRWARVLRPGWLGGRSGRN